jgi:hypothetical protein
LSGGRKLISELRQQSQARLAMAATPEIAANEMKTALILPWTKKADAAL